MSIKVTQSLRGEDLAKTLERMNGARCTFTAELDKDGALKNISIQSDGDDEINIRGTYGVVECTHTKVPATFAIEMRVKEGSELEKRLTALHIPTRAMFIAPQTKKDAAAFAKTLHESVGLCGPTEVHADLYQVEIRMEKDGAMKTISEKQIDFDDNKSGTDLPF